MQVVKAKLAIEADVIGHQQSNLGTDSSIRSDMNVPIWSSSEMLSMPRTDYGCSLRPTPPPPQKARRYPTVLNCSSFHKV